MSQGHDIKQQLLLTLNSLLRTVRIHDDKNQQSIDCADNFINAVVTACPDDSGEFTLHISNGRFFFDDEKVLHDTNSAALLQMMLDYFEKRQLTGFTFWSAIKEANRNDILAYARIVNEAGEKENPSAWLKEKINENNLHWVEIFEPNQDYEDTVADREKEGISAENALSKESRGENARKIYSYGLANLKEVARKLGSGRRAGINKSVRLVQNMVNLLKDDETVMLSLSTLRIYDDYTYAHSVNVALLALCIGKRIGLSRNALEKLGLCGLFHDLGKVDIPQSILKKPGKLTNQERNIMRSHSMHSVRHIAMLRAPRSRKSQLVLAPFEHHMKFDHSGYPKASNWKISLFGRIIAISDVFDAITSPRVYRKASLSPDRALGFMVTRAGKDFDPILMKVLVNMLGLYPPGTLVELDNDEIGLVINTPADNYASGLPMVKLLLPDGHNGYIKGETINLTERSPETGDYLRKIVNTVHPAVYNIQPAQYLF